MVKTDNGTMLGKCALDRTFEAFLAHNNDNAKENQILLDKLEKYGWQTDPETGKLRKITGKTKALNRAETMETK